MPIFTTGYWKQRALFDESNLLQIINVGWSIDKKYVYKAFATDQQRQNLLVWREDLLVIFTSS